jgi:tripartite ATP-independent transporter DctP family solute receptor
MKPTLWLAASLLLGAALPGGAQVLRSADVHNADDYPTVLAVKHMGDALSKATGGRLSVKVFNKGALGNEKETIQQAKIGALDLTRVNISPMNSICPATLVPTMPFIFRDVAHMRRALDGHVGEEILKSCEGEGFIGLAFYDSGARGIYAKKPVKTIGDVKGLKIRVQQSDLWVALIQAMGGNPTPMPYGEVYTALKTGLVDAAENNIPSFETSKHHEAVKHYSRTEHSMAPEMLIMSRKSWDKLSAADRALIRSAAKASVDVQRKAWDAQESRSLAAITAGGTKVHEVDKAGFRAAMAPVYARFLNTPALQRLAQSIKDTP